MNRLSPLLTLPVFLGLGCGQVASTGQDGGAAGRGGTTGAAGTTGAGGGATAGTTGGGGSGGGCSLGGVTYPPGPLPSPDGCNSCTCTPDGQIACTDRACPPDGGPPACMFADTYRYGDTGGHVVYEDEVTLAPQASYTYARRPTSSTTPTIVCSPALPACDATDLLDVADVVRDIAHADVQRALSMVTPPLYGSDPRPVDGNIFSFKRADGRGFLAGGACTGTGTTCVAIPTGISRLVTTLRALDQQQLNDASCAALR